MSDPSYPNPPAPPPGQPYQQPAQPYHQAGYSQLREHPDGTTVLVLGILSLVICQILGPFAWIKGNQALAQIDATPGVYSNRSNISAGRICGIISSVLLIFSLLAMIGFGILVLAAGVSESS